MSRANRAVFRMPAASAAIPLVAVLCVTPLATVGGGWWALYAIPVIAAVYIVVTRTTADGAQVTAHSLLGAKRMSWSDMDGLELRDARWTVAVGKDGRRLPLPMVRPRDLPRLAAASGGSLNLGPQASDDADATDSTGDAHGAVPADGAGAPDGTGADTAAVGDTESAAADGSQDAALAADSAPDNADNADCGHDTDRRPVTADAPGARQATSAD